MFNSSDGPVLVPPSSCTPSAGTSQTRYHGNGFRGDEEVDCGTASPGQALHERGGKKAILVFPRASSPLLPSATDASHRFASQQKR
jgi:hypothetical protein